MKTLMLLVASWQIIGAPLPAQAGGFRAATYNVGLAHGYVPHAKERLPLLAEAISETPADLLCLQEVWKPADREIILRQAKTSFPYAHFVEPAQKYVSKRSICNVGDLFGEGKPVTCMQKDCKGQKGDAFTRCFIDKCRDSMDWLTKTNRECANALVAQVGKNPVSSLISLIGPFKPGVFSYGGAIGTVLLSRLPFKRTGYLDLAEDATTVNRGVLYAEVEVGQKSLFAACTHLTANLVDSAPYTGKYRSWEEENAVQFKRLAELADEQATAASARMLMGDFNCSVADPEHKIAAEMEANCKLPLQAGYADPAQQGTKECTWCAYNTLVHDSPDTILDHLYIQGLSTAGASGRVIFKQLVPVQQGRETIASNLSDHFGYLLELP